MLSFDPNILNSYSSSTSISSNEEVKVSTSDREKPKTIGYFDKIEVKDDISNSLLTSKDKTIARELNIRKGNCRMYFFDKEGIPLIVIGPNCK